MSEYDDLEKWKKREKKISEVGEPEGTVMRFEDEVTLFNKMVKTCHMPDIAEGLNNIMQFKGYIESNLALMDASLHRIRYSPDPKANMEDPFVKYVVKKRDELRKRYRETDSLLSESIGLLWNCKCEVKV